MLFICAGRKIRVVEWYLLTMERLGMKCGWKNFKLCEVAEVVDSLHKTPKYVESGIPMLRVTDIREGYLSLHSAAQVSNAVYDEFTKKYRPQQGDIVISRVGTYGIFSYVATKEKFCLGQNTAIIIPHINNKFLYYILISPVTKSYLEKIVTGSTQKTVSLKNIKEIPVCVPDNITQKRIANILSALDDKIELNNAINHNLQQQAFAIFDNMFPCCSIGEKTIGDYTVPKRGRNLLSKDAVFGEVPVVAGGLEPATYHNKSNTVAPVLTISASGANAGFVNLWHKSVWSSDSSYIDLSMTSDVYFWFVLLKKRQKEIFDAQTGSAQPHIYPQHIADMPICNLDKMLVSQFTAKVSPLFELIGANKEENIIFAQCTFA